MAIKRRRSEASILASFLISKRNKPAFSRTCKDRSEATLLILYLRRSKRNKFCLFHKFERSKQSELCLFLKLERSQRSEVCLFHKFERSKRSKLCLSTNWKDRRGGIFKTFMEPRNRFQGIDSASLCPGGPVQQPYSSSVPSPLRLFSCFSTVLVFLNNPWGLGTE